MKHWRAKAGLLAAAAGYAGLRVLAAGGKESLFLIHRDGPFQEQSEP